ncbi:MAG TPA: ATP-dependent RNA helicase HrpA [Actinomycetaceae bacterium]|nr:ATP-dependent RNA helicase HrpA [Actinomycetaceae bacterium]
MPKLARRRPAYTPEQIANRRASLPAIRYPEELPVSVRREDIARAIAENQVVVVSGETGSGKTTQIPKICLELGRGITGMIGHTQPRRIAARSVADRISEELGVELGTVVGYQVRFTDLVSGSTLVKLMTDGILLAEIQRDPMLTRYDTIIIDEAHERSLNIDFLLGYLAGLLPRRPDLKLIITSATIDSARFAAHFGPRTAAAAAARKRGDRAEAGRPAPVVEVSGRTYPVEIRWRPLVPDDDAEPIDQFTGICLAVDELMTEGPGDILVFLSGEREIRDAEDALIDHLGERHVNLGARHPRPDAVEIVPLYARLSAAEQHRIFEKHIPRRIVLATNVAETSLTVPGIRYVVDPGTARISRYSTRTKVQRLPIEPIAQASANQRSGRSGRVIDGIAIRLYSEADFTSRPEYTEPEILRTSLASVILQMAAIGLGDVEKFPFVDPPDTRAIRDGVAQLIEIGALEVGAGAARGRDGTGSPPGSPPGSPSGTAPRLTTIGRQLARLPIDPRLGRMLLEADKNGCASEVLVIVAALSVQDVRERPTEKQQQADQFHRRFTDPSSDFLAYLNLWRYLRVRQRDLGSSAFRRLARTEYLNFLRFREWQDVVGQLRQLARPLGMTLRPISLPREHEFPRDATSAEIAGAVVAYGQGPGAAAADDVHRSLLVGLLGNLGTWDEQRRDYEGARGTHFVIWPGSGLVKKRYDWVMAAELVETSRLFARTVSRIDARWIEPAAAHLVKRQHSEPYWSSRNGAAMVHEKVTLYGLTVVADRTILLASLGSDLARADAREMFIRHALVGGEWRSRHKFVAENRALLEEAEELENRARRRGLVADDGTLFDFYDERLPDNIVSSRHFDAWWKNERHSRPELLTFSRGLLLPNAHIDESAFPTTWRQGDLTLPITYNFDPTARDDGLTIHIPIAVLARVADAGFDWLVPGMRDELAVATIKALPKRTRVQLVPAPDTAAAIVRFIDDDGAAPAAETQASGYVAPEEPWTDAFARAARAVRGVGIPPEEFDPEGLPKHLRATFQVEAPNGTVMAASKSLFSLQRRLAAESREAVRSVVRGAVRAARAEEEHAAEERAAPGGASSGRTAGAGRSPDAGVAAGEGGGVVVGMEERPELTDFPGEAIPGSVTSRGPGGFEVRGYPALMAGVDGSVALRVLPSALDQARAHPRGAVGLALSQVRLGTDRVTTRWGGAAALALATSPYPSTAALVEDVQRHAALALAEEWAADHVPLDSLRRRADFDSLVAFLRERLEDGVFRVVGVLVEVLTAWRETDRAIRESSSLALLDTVSEVREQVSGLVYPGFASATPASRLSDLVRYLKAARMRVERAASSPRGDATSAWKVRDLTRDWEEAVEAQARMAPDPAREAMLAEVRWLLEEYRVSLFAQQLGTRGKVSEVRIRRMLED